MRVRRYTYENIGNSSHYGNREPSTRKHRFYKDTFGLKFVKQTVNFDDPTTYHCYFGDEKGSLERASGYYILSDSTRQFSIVVNPSTGICVPDKIHNYVK